MIYRTLIWEESIFWGKSWVPGTSVNEQKSSQVMKKSWPNFIPDRWVGHDSNHFKRSLKHPKKVTKNSQGIIFVPLTKALLREKPVANNPLSS